MKAIVGLCSLLTPPPLTSTPCRNGGNCVYKAAGRCRFVHAHVASLSSDQVHRSCQPGEPSPSFTPPNGAYPSRGSQEPLHNNRLIVNDLSPRGTAFPDNRGGERVPERGLPDRRENRFNCPDRLVGPLPSFTPPSEAYSSGGTHGLLHRDRSVVHERIPIRDSLVRHVEVQVGHLGDHYPSKDPTTLSTLRRLSPTSTPPICSSLGTVSIDSAHRPDHPTHPLTSDPLHPWAL